MLPHELSRELARRAPKIRAISHSVARRLPSGMTHDDLVSVGTEAVWRILSRMPDAPDRYVYKKVRWVMTDAIRQWTTRRRPVMTSVDAPDGPDLFDPKTLPDILAERSEVSERLEAAILELPRRTRTVLMRRLMGDRIDAVAADYGVTAPRITQIAAAAAAELRRKIGRGT